MRDLSLTETRVIGSLIEKKITTPDQYPLSLNALTNACNQKSSREPVLNLAETEVLEVLDALSELNLVAEVSIGSRVKKYQHRFCNTEFSRMHLAPPELAIMCCLFLRGPQTAGELRGRTARLHEFKSAQEVEGALQELTDRDDGALVVKLPREPGRREARFMHLLSGDDIPHMEVEPGNTESEASPNGSTHSERISALEQQVLSLQNEIDILKRNWEELNA